MPRKPRAARRAQPTQSLGDDIFDHFAKTGRSAEVPQEPENRQADPSVADLVARLEKMDAENKTLRESFDRFNAAPATQATQQTYQVDPSKLKLDLNGMPDYVADPEKFQAELQTRINGVMEARQFAQASESQSRAQLRETADQMWNGFVGKFADWKEYPEIVNTVSKQLVEEVQQRGGDAKRYTMGTTDLFYTDLDKRLREKYGRLVAEQDDPSEEDQLLAHGRRQGLREDGDDGRTTVFGGQESGGRPGAGQKAPKGDFIKDLTDLQRGSGFF